MSAKAGSDRETTPRRSVQLEQVSLDLSEQIIELREMMAFIAGRYQSEQDLKILAGLLDKYSQASTRLAALLKSQRALAGDKGLGEALNQALAEVLETMPGVRQIGP